MITTSSRTRSKKPSGLILLPMGILGIVPSGWVESGVSIGGSFGLAKLEGLFYLKKWPRLRLLNLLDVVMENGGKSFFHLELTGQWFKLDDSIHT
ncbi:hypothetical protein Tco_1474740 [Tanacetum coccineum]